MVEDTLLPFSLPSVQRKKITAAFDGGRMTSDGGVMLLAPIESSLGVAAKLASVITDPRNEEGTTTTPFDMTVLNGLNRFTLALAAIERVDRIRDVSYYSN